MRNRQIGPMHAQPWYLASPGDVWWSSHRQSTPHGRAAVLQCEGPYPRASFWSASTVAITNKHPADAHRDQRVDSGFGLRRQIELTPVGQGPDQLDVFGMRPDQRHGRPGGMSVEELSRRQVRGVPALLREHAALAGLPFHDFEQRAGFGGIAGRQFIVRPFAGQQRQCRVVPGCPQHRMTFVAAAASRISRAVNPPGEDSVKRRDDSRRHLHRPPLL